MLGALAGLALSSSGAVFLCGGGPTPPAVVQAFLAETGLAGKVLVCGQTRADPADAVDSVDLLHEHGATNVVIAAFDRPTPGEMQWFRDELATARGVWIPGGDQGAFMQRVGESARDAFVAAHRRGAVFFGTSAGAMALGGPLILGYGPSHETARLGRGLGIVPFIVDSHYRQRGRGPRLADASRQAGGAPTLGLDEGEWVVVRSGKVERRFRPRADGPSGLAQWSSSSFLCCSYSLTSACCSPWGSSSYRANSVRNIPRPFVIERRSSA